MKQKLLLPLILFGLCINLMAQPNNKRPHLSKEEYQAKLEAFLVQEAGLTSEESTRFIPLYNECQTKKHQLNCQIWDLRKKARDNNNLEEKEYQQILEEICNLRIKIDELDKAYLPKYNKILSYKKIFAVQGAEAKFHREMLKNMRKKK